MPEEPNTPAPAAPAAPPAVGPVAPTGTATPPEGAPDPWADPEVARKEIEKLRRENASHRTRNKELEPLAQKAKELEDAQKTEQERLTEQLTQAQERAAKAVRTAVGAKVEALAAATFADPEDAAGALDLAAYADDDGVIDTEAIRKDLDDLLERKPHWAKSADSSPRPPAPDRTQGSSGNGNRSTSDPGVIFAGLMNQALKGR